MDQGLGVAFVVYLMLECYTIFKTTLSESFVAYVMTSAQMALRGVFCALSDQR